MMKRILLIISLLILVPAFLFAQDSIPPNPEEYLKALEALQKKDTTSAINLFEESIRLNGDAPSYYELAKIFWQKKNFLLRNNAFEYIKMAVLKDEKNIEYKYFYADVCQSFAKSESINQWKEIIAIDSMQIKAWINLAEFSGNVFAEFDKSIRQFILKDPVVPKRPVIINMPMQGKAAEDFTETISYYKHALQIDSTNYNLCLSLGLFYAKNNLPVLGIKHVKRLELLNRADKYVYQCLGLLYYKARKFKESYEYYSKALELMSGTEWEDFAVNSVKFILETSDSHMKEMTQEELKNYIYDYWRTNDPLLMTDYNERLLEHYSRVAYANLCFSIPRLKIVGWKSNRGEMVLRYGEPLSMIRIRPGFSGGMDRGPEHINYLGGKDVLMDTHIKTEVWNYNDFSILLEDPWFNGNFQFDNLQLLFINDLRKNQPAIFYPRFDGPIFNLQNQTYQFVSDKKQETDVYLSYVINFSDTSTSKEKFADGYDVGIFMLDNSFNKKIDYKKTYTSVDQTQNNLVNSLEMTLPSQSGNLAFEMMRKKDKGVTSYHGKFNVRKFSNDKLDISDVVLATNVETGKEINGCIKRKDISVLPNPTRIFGKEEEFYLYYEIYNLKLNSNNLTDFEQRLTIQRKEEGGVLNSILSVVGLDKEGKKVALTSKYQTQEKDPQMYLQLDMSKYEPGEYLITVSIKDNATGKEVSSQTEIKWE